MKAVLKKPVPKLDKDLLVARFRKSPILDRLLPEREEAWTPVLKRPLLDKTPAISLKNFSFLDHPDQALASLKQIAAMEGVVTAAQLHFEDEYCLDAGAYLVLAEVWPHLARVFHGGKMSGPIQKVLNATGVGRHNRMRLRAAEADAEFIFEGRHADIWPFPLQRRRPARTSQSPSVHLDPQTREEAADIFCSTINDWIGVPEVEQELTDLGKAWIGGIIGELLCNAERHSQRGSTDGDWSATGFMVRRDGVLRCYMAFLSVGQSFAESLEQAAPEIREFVREYTRKHWVSGLPADALATLVALQDAVTCDPAAFDERSGGTGLQDVLEFVSYLAGPPDRGDTRITIVSGKTCIRLRHPYLVGLREEAGKPRKLWCNGSNSSAVAPDAGIVDTLAEHFAGTLVSVAFTLDPGYLASLVETNDDDDNQSRGPDGEGQGAQPEWPSPWEGGSGDVSD